MNEPNRSHQVRLMIYAAFGTIFLTNVLFLGLSLGLYRPFLASEQKTIKQLGWIMVQYLQFFGIKPSVENVVKSPVPSPSSQLSPIPPPIFSPQPPQSPQPSSLPPLSSPESPVTPYSTNQSSTPRIPRPSPLPEPQPSPSPSIERPPSRQGKTPVELGQAQYQVLVTQAKNTLSYMNPQTLVMFPMGINQPLRLNATQPRNNFQNFYAIGYVDSRKQPQPLTVGDLVELLEQQAGELYYANRDKELLLVSIMLEDHDIGQKNVAVIDLIVYNTRDKQMYFVPNTQVNSLLKDTLNAIYNKTLEVHQLDVRQLSLSHIQNP